MLPGSSRCAYAETYDTYNVENAHVQARSTLNSERDAFMVEMRGWDTHFDRFDSVEQNYKSLSDAVNQFSSEMKAENIWDGVTVVITSDFGISFCNLDKC